MEHEAELNEMIVAAIVIVSVCTVLFLFCMFGESLTEQFSMLDEKLNQSIDWYLFPIGVQRMLLTVMSNTQQSVTIRGYGNIECTRDTFKAVGGDLHIRMIAKPLEFNLFNRID